jgi:hypothetical protein
MRSDEHFIYQGLCRGDLLGNHSVESRGSLCCRLLLPSVELMILYANLCTWPDFFLSKGGLEVAE